MRTLPNNRNLQLYTSIYFKYDNPNMPNLPKVIVSYLLDNPDKLGYYLTPKVHVGMLLDELARCYRQDSNYNLLEAIKTYMEVTICKTI